MESELRFILSRFPAAFEKRMCVRPSKGQGVFSRQAFHFGETVHNVVDFLIVNAPTKLSVSRNSRFHLVDSIIAGINHSCEPNVEVEVERGSLKALRSIEPEEEITLFYPATEWNLFEPFVCACASSNCLRRIYGASTLPSDILSEYALTGHIQALKWAQEACEATDFSHNKKIQPLFSTSSQTQLSFSKLKAHRMRHGWHEQRRAQ